MKTSYVNNIMHTVTKEIMVHCNKQACTDFPKGRKVRNLKDGHVSAKWKRIFKLCDYQCRAMTGKRSQKVTK